MIPAIRIHHLKKSFQKIEVFRDLNLNIDTEKITALVGPNGSGKSTLLHILAGLTPQDGGTFYIKDFDYFTFSYIFQNYRDSLLPWLTNFENIALPLRIQKKSNREIQQKFNQLQKIFTFTFNWEQYPYALSGGQQQILAFARALITEPKILFIDEPFSALDYENNLLLRECLQKYYLSKKPTILLITHNLEETVHLAENIVVLSQKPTRPLKTIHNPLSYPRTLQSLKEKQFYQIKERVLSSFQKATGL